ncbi:hypothetical protein BJ138DRAFT_1018281 [Hygrophoropsis aurantiaca]|uniref:Uncharacterized protein n=1 Tax=Hygrophoropsis aurantiaca TaxID=72124 RepID=A0ACB7ZWG8_9AGAM|nr:hypothetical protein BJ138DRAFT_1018281 [Hygrophoropsis aurantiaca]
MWTGKVKDPSIPRVTYNTAQKMRAAISHKFGHDHGLGTQQWTEHPMIPGKFVGNPSLSVTVSQYMISLRRRKVRAGEQVTSARAMDEPTMKRLYDFNISTSQKDVSSVSRKRKAEHPAEWAGFLIRMMLHLLYVVSLLCLLRYDEALRISWADVTFQPSNNPNARPPTDFRIQLAMPFRKTHQYGGIAPFYLYPDVDRPWMCPVRAFAVWWTIARERNRQLDGFVFRKKIGVDSVSVNATDGMSSESFLECFRNNLLDIGIDPRPYGTHSFRRGGCQYLAKVLHWPLRQICNWGSWADNFDNPGTIFKYLLSWSDNPFEEREHYFNPNRPGTDPCRTCGRTCHCA